MSDITNEPAEERFDVERFADIVRRRHLHFLIPMFVGWLAVWGCSWLLQARYKSSTLILVEQPTMPKDYVQPNVNDDLQGRLQSISQQILSRTRLLLIIDKLNLYQDAGPKATGDDKVARMQKDINIELVRDSRDNEITAFRVSYSAKDPHVAQQVTSELTNLFINENQRVLEEESEGTTKFIESQLEDARAHLSEQEAKVKAFESMHEGDLPSQQASNLQILSGLQSQLQNEEDALNTAKQQRVYLQALVEQNRPPKGALHGNEAVSPAIAAIDDELATMRSQLADLTTRYTDQYPDVLRLKQKIANTEKEREELIANPGSDAARAAESSRSVSGPSSTFQQLQGQLQANQLEIANREHSIAGLEGRINQYQNRLNGAPATEQQLDELNRGYEQSKANYDELLKKKNESAMATSMEQMQQGERFTILDPPSLPVKPDFPNRLKFCGFGVGIGIVLGLLVAGSLEWMDDRLYDEKELKSLLPIAVISEVPDILGPADERRTRRSMAFKWSMTAAVLTIIAVGAVLSYLHG